CMRTENPELFRLVHGGYGLFGTVTAIQLRLVPRRKVERVVEIRTVDDLMAAFDKPFLTDFNMVISNSLSSATLKTSCTKVFSPAIAHFRWRRPSRPHRSNCPMRIGGNYCISPT